MAAYIEIEEPDALDKLLSDAGISIVPAERAEAQEQTVAFLRELEKLPANEPEGGVRIIVHGKHISLKVVLWEIAAGSLALLPKTLDPSGVSQIVGAAAFGGSLIKLRDKITPLKDFQLIVCYAVVKVAQSKKARKQIYTEPGASVDEVRIELRTQLGQDFPNIGDVLRNLAPKVLTEKFYDSSGPFYELVP